MRAPLCLLLAGLGCNAIFEENPTFTATADGTGVGTAGSEPTATAGSETPSTAEGGSGTTVSPPTECGTDMYEPNDVQSQSAQAGDVDTDELVLEIEAQVEDTADEDWFKVNVDRVGATTPMPAVTLLAPETLAVCLRLACADGELAFDCGAYDVASSDDGCCGADAVSLTYDCEGATDLDGFMYLQVTAAAAVDACIPYVATVGA